MQPPKAFTFGLVLEAVADRMPFAMDVVPDRCRGKSGPTIRCLLGQVQFNAQALKLLLGQCEQRAQQNDRSAMTYEILLEHFVATRPVSHPQTGHQLLCVDGHLDGQALKLSCMEEVPRRSLAQIVNQFRAETVGQQAVQSARIHLLDQVLQNHALDRRIDDVEHLFFPLSLVCEIGGLLREVWIGCDSPDESLRVIQAQLLHGAQQLHGEIAQLGLAEHDVDLSQQHCWVSTVCGHASQGSYIVLTEHVGASSGKTCPVRDVFTDMRKPLRVELPAE